MPEPIIEPIIADELEVLRRTNGELITKSATRKAKIAELESTVTALQSKLSEAHDSMRQVTIDGPLKALAGSISSAPDIWLEKFTQLYRVEMIDGQLTLQTHDGKPILKDAKPLPLERQSLIDYLTTGDTPQAKMFKSITIVSRASGAAVSPAKGVSTEIERPSHRFGLR